MSNVAGVFTSLLVTFYPNIAGLCNGSTTDSGSVRQGSNPCPAAKKSDTFYVSDFFFSIDKNSIKRNPFKEAQFMNI